jgi:soluble epoxide hydrolase / lipid-phosphate phosphatase
MTTATTTKPTSHYLDSPHGPLHYLLAGPSTGPLLIFIHGWPGLAKTWLPQLNYFSTELGFRCAAMDTLGYGLSPRPTTNLSDYSCTSLASHQLLLLAELKTKSAVFVGHDWGCGPVSVRNSSCLLVAGAKLGTRTFSFPVFL